jgi:hypothetical protein
MGRSKKYQSSEEAITIQKKQVKDAQVRYKETRSVFRKNASSDQKGLIKFLNHSILTPENAKELFTSAKDCTETRQIADMLSEVKADVQEESKTTEERSSSEEKKE